MQKENEKLVNSSNLEGMTSIRALIRAIKDQNPTNDRRIKKILYNKEKLSEKDRVIQYLLHEGKLLDFTLEAAPANAIQEMAIGTSHGGIIAICSNRTIPYLNLEAIKPDGFYCMIQGIEDPYNFGYALRSLYASGATGIILPERNWLTAAGVVSRASAGASELFEIYTCDALFCADLFHKAGYRVLCADLRTENILYESDLTLPLLLLIGGERRGISRALLEKSDLRVKLDYGRDFHASLSAASSATIFGYEIFRQNHQKFQK